MLGAERVGRLEIWDTSRASGKEVLDAIWTVCPENWDTT
jgi:hypothetical protein